MAFLNISCPVCQIQGKAYRKRRSGIRYAPIFDSANRTIGEFRYYELRCHQCETLFYVQERRLYEASDKPAVQIIVPQEVFEKASFHKPGDIWIGATVSDYSVKIASGADHPYALKIARR